MWSYSVWKGECLSKDKTHLTAFFGHWAIPLLENWALQQLPLPPVEKGQVIQECLQLPWSGFWSKLSAKQLLHITLLAWGYRITIHLNGESKQKQQNNRTKCTVMQMLKLFFSLLFWFCFVFCGLFVLLVWVFFQHVPAGSHQQWKMRRGCWTYWLKSEVNCWHRSTIVVML